MRKFTYLYILQKRLAIRQQISGSIGSAYRVRQKPIQTALLCPNIGIKVSKLGVDCGSGNEIAGRSDVILALRT